MAQIFVMVSGCGGTGKSYVTASLALSMAAFYKKKVLIIDLNRPFGVIDALFSADEERLFDLGDLLNNRASVENTIIPITDNLHIIAAAQRLDETTESDDFKALLARLLPLYDCIFIDSAPDLSTPLKTAFICGGTGIVVCTLDDLSVKGAAFASDALKKHNTGEDGYLLLNRVNIGRKAPLPDIDRIIDTVGLRLAGAVPNDGSFLKDALKHGLSPGERIKNKGSPAAFFRIASRLFGEQQPLPNLFKL